MAQGNGHPDDSAFDIELPLRLRALEASGMQADYLKSLQEKLQGMGEVLRKYRAKRRALGDSGRYTAHGLEEAAADEAAKAAGELRRIGEMSGLLDNLRQVEEQLKPQAKADPTEALLSFWRQMEIRSTLVGQGISPADPIMADMTYRAALERGDSDTMQALEGWPLKCPVSPELVAQGQQQRAAALNPVAAQRRDQLAHFRDTLAQSVADALRELPLAQPDPIAAMAQGKASEAASDEVRHL
jgi:hypothetical protein